MLCFPVVGARAAPSADVLGPAVDYAELDRKMREEEARQAAAAAQQQQ